MCTSTKKDDTWGEVCTCQGPHHTVGNSGSKKLTEANLKKKVGAQEDSNLIWSTKANLVAEVLEVNIPRRIW